jgi:pyridinium-3,5-biscarboxylic acid mononucleotide synthase
MKDSNYMDQKKLRDLLYAVQTGDLELDQALEKLRTLPFEDLSFARLDYHRELRQGLPEVIFCQSKTPDQVALILQRLQEQHGRALGTRASPKMAAEVQNALPQTRYDPISRILQIPAAAENKPGPDQPYAMVVTGGTSDIPVAEEAAQTLEFLGSKVERAYDVGVSGVHRLFQEQDRLIKSDVIISVAGMEGALTSVVGGLVSCPVIGVPTSVGYGASFNGISALLSMLNACAPGIAVVNIDNGFGAAVYAHLILKRIQS